MDATAMFTFPSGLYVVSASTANDYGACVINTGLQVTAEPLQVQVIVNKENYTTGVIQHAGHFALCPITEEADMDFIGRFGFRTSTSCNKFDGIKSGVTALGDRYPAECVAAVISARVVQMIDLGTHVLYVGVVEDAEKLSSANSLTYAYYHAVLKGKTPPKASSYVAEEPKAEAGAAASAAPAAAPAASNGMHHFRCTICGYEVEWPDDELPADFSCPICGVGPEMFEKVD